MEKGTRSDIACITHQCARFTSDPKKEHSDAIKRIGRHLKGTRDKGLTMEPNEEKGLEVHVDADFSGNWDHSDSNNRDTARSRHGCMITHHGCPML